MKYILIFSFILLQLGCSKQKTVLICGDHVCVNKAEAEQYFEENLTLEVKIINKKKPNTVDLVQLNLKSNEKGKREISINKTNKKKDLKVLSNQEIKEVKKKIKSKNSNRKIEKQAKLKKKEVKKKTDKKILKNSKSVNKDNKKIVDICTILEKCSIDEISKYLIKQGKSKKFPDITTME